MEKVKKFLWYFGAFYLGVGGIGISILTIVDKEQFNIGILIAALVLVALSYLCFKKGMAIKKNTEDVDKVIQDIIINAKHVVGLPIAEGVECVINYSAENIEITQGNNTFNLSISKVTDITDTTDVEIQKQYVSSTGGAVGGYMLFGPLGAIVGGRAKKKTSKKVTNYLVITYRDSEEIKYISFEYAPMFNLKVIKLVDRFNDIEKQQISINL